MADGNNPRAVIGGNNPPPDPFDALTLHAADLRIEVGNYCDGAKIETAGQAADVDRLISDVKAALDAVAEARETEIKPLTDQVTTIREKWYPLDGTTKKVTGSLVAMKTALLAVKSDWGRREDARIAKETAEARKAAEEAAQRARDALRQAEGNLDATEEAEALVRDARTAQSDVRQIEQTAVKGMRDNYVWKGFEARVEQPDGSAITGETAFLRYLWNTRLPDLLEAGLSLVADDIRRGRTVPGLTIVNERRAV